MEDITPIKYKKHEEDYELAKKIRNLNKSKLARAVGMNRSAFHHLVNGKFRTSEETYEKLKLAVSMYDQLK